MSRRPSKVLDVRYAIAAGALCVALQLEGEGDRIKKRDIGNMRRLGFTALTAWAD